MVVEKQIRCSIPGGQLWQMFQQCEQRHPGTGILAQAQWTACYWTRPIVMGVCFVFVDIDKRRRMDMDVYV
jgi:hypothetical protein